MRPPSNPRSCTVCRDSTIPAAARACSRSGEMSTAGAENSRSAAERHASLTCQLGKKVHLWMKTFHIYQAHRSVSFFQTVQKQKRRRSRAVQNSLGGVTPVAFDLSTLVPRSVASLFSHLVTRPTGQALRLGIESQLGELGPFCVSVLDFSQVMVLDYSCADEVIAKLILNYQRDDR